MRVALWMFFDALRSVLSIQRREKVCADVQLAIVVYEKSLRHTSKGGGSVGVARGSALIDWKDGVSPRAFFAAFRSAPRFGIWNAAKRMKNPSDAHRREENLFAVFERPEPGRGLRFAVQLKPRALEILRGQAVSVGQRAGERAVVNTPTAA